MTRLWKFLRDPLNLSIIVAIAGGLAFLWQHVIEPIVKPPSSPKMQTPNVQHATANNNSAAVAASGQAQVSIGSSLDPAGRAVEKATQSTVPVSQDAEAGSGGTSVAAKDSARVQIKRPVSESKN